MVLKFYRQGRWKDARAALTQSLALAERLQMPEEAAVSRRNLAELELLQGNLAASLAQADAATALFRAREDLRGQSDVGLLRVQALLAAGQRDDAAKALAELKPALQGASTEQQALAWIAQARVDAGGARGSAKNAARMARSMGSLSRVRALALEGELVSAEATGAAPSATLDKDTATLGNAPLRLRWLEYAMRRALAQKDRAAAAAHYREALTWLRAGSWLRAEALHRLGAQAATDAGDIALATERANAAHADFVAHLPAHLRANAGALATQ